MARLLILRAGPVICWGATVAVPVRTNVEVSGLGGVRSTAGLAMCSHPERMFALADKLNVGATVFNFVAVACAICDEDID